MTKKVIFQNPHMSAIISEIETVKRRKIVSSDSLAQLQNTEKLLELL